MTVTWRRVESWVDLAIELKFSEMIDTLNKKATERIIGEDDAELFSLIEIKNIEEVSRRNKCEIAMSLRDWRVTKIQDYFEKSRKFVAIGDGITTIPRLVFEDDEVLKSIIIPPSVAVIEDCAFNECFSLKTIHFSVTKLGNQCSRDVPPSGQL